MRYEKRCDQYGILFEVSLGQIVVDGRDGYVGMVIGMTHWLTGPPGLAVRRIDIDEEYAVTNLGQVVYGAQDWFAAWQDAESRVWFLGWDDENKRMCLYRPTKEKVAWQMADSARDALSQSRQVVTQANNEQRDASDGSTDATEGETTRITSDERPSPRGV